MNPMHKVINDLKAGRKKIGIWGLGYIGYSTISFYAKNGVKVIGFDINKHKVESLNKAKIDIPNIEYWLGFDVEPLVSSGMIEATNNWRDLISPAVAAHFICIPTEKDALPYDAALSDVVKKIAAYDKIKVDLPPLIIIESTIAVDRLEKVVFKELKNSRLKLGKDVLLAVAPRRDWFVSAEKSIVSIPRVVGGIDKRTTDFAADILGIVSHTVLKASDCYHAALIKSVENTYRQVGIALANQLSLAYPNINMAEVLSLVGTKWNIDTYHPSFGIGGYCIPLAPKYVLHGAARPEKLTILRESVSSADDMPRQVVAAILSRNPKKVGILGLAYKGDLKVDILSPAKDIVSILKDNGISVKVHDPYYTVKEIKQKCGVDAFDFPQGMNGFDVILLVADHSLYKYTPQIDIVKNVKRCKYVLDNIGAWREIKWPKGVRYYEAGIKNWLNLGRD